MTDRDKVMKVIKGLECCRAYDYKCDGCPYADGGGAEDGCYSDELKTDALTLLKAQEPRVMTLEELFLLRFDDVVYVEMYPALAIISAIVVDSIPWIQGELGVLQIRCTQEPLANMDFAWYGKTWRCWTARPTDEQRKAVKWDE